MIFRSFLFGRDQPSTPPPSSAQLNAPFTHLHLVSEARRGETRCCPDCDQCAGGQPKRVRLKILPNRDPTSVIWSSMDAWLPSVRAGYALNPQPTRGWTKILGSRGCLRRALGLTFVEIVSEKRNWSMKDVSAPDCLRTGWMKPSVVSCVLPRSQARNPCNS